MIEGTTIGVIKGDTRSFSLKRGYIGGCIGEYAEAYKGGYSEFRL